MSHSTTLSHGCALDGDSSRPEVALVITTYHKPWHLRLVLASVALQQEMDGRLEIVVADDGSTDETYEVVERFAESVDWPVKLATHRHVAFEVARCRNEGVAASSAPYLVFIDGDCLVPRDFVFQHLRRRKPGVVMFSETFRLEQEISGQIDEDAARSGDYDSWVSAAEITRLKHFDRRARWNNLIRHPRKPHLIGCNVGIWRPDFERVNGYDQDFQGWGQEDDDFGYRLRQTGVGIQSIFRWTRTFHVWHPRDTSWTQDWRQGPNVARFLDANRPMRCLNGLVKLGSTDVAADRIVHSFDDYDEAPSLPFVGAKAERPQLPSRRLAA